MSGSELLLIGLNILNQELDNMVYIASLKV